MSPPARTKRLLVIDDAEAIHTDFRRLVTQAQAQSRSELDVLAEALFGASAAAGASAPPVVFEVDSAFQGQEGVDKVREALEAGRPYALVFLDYRMPPGWNGAETLRHLRAVAPSLPVVLCSAYTDYSWGEIWREFGGSPLLKELRKPFNGHEVRRLALEG